MILDFIVKVFQQQITSLCKVQLNWDIAFAFSRLVNWWTWTETFKLYNYLLENLTFVINNLGAFPVDSLIISFPDVNSQSTFDVIFTILPQSSLASFSLTSKQRPYSSKLTSFLVFNLCFIQGTLIQRYKDPILPLNYTLVAKICKNFEKMSRVGSGVQDKSSS